jgi:hypothetical protein
MDGLRDRDSSVGAVGASESARLSFPLRCHIRPVPAKIIPITKRSSIARFRPHDWLRIYSAFKNRKGSIVNE